MNPVRATSLTPRAVGLEMPLTLLVRSDEVTIVPPDGAGGIAVALRIGACARCQRAADLPAGKHLRVTFAGGSLKPLLDGWFFGFSRNRNYRAGQG